MQAIFHSLGITDIWQLIAATMVFLLLPGPGTFCVLTCAAKGGLRGPPRGPDRGPGGGRGRRPAPDELLASL